TLSGTAAFSVLVADNSTPQRTLTASLSLTIKPLPLLFSYPSTPIPTIIGTPISQAPILTGGAAPYTFAISNGTLPTGLTLNPDGSISGTPTGTPATSGITTIEIAATDSSSPNQTIIAPLSLNVIDAVVHVDTTTTLTTVPQTAFGIHTSVYDTSLSDTAALPALLHTTGITTLRYPGGSYSDAYHWAQYTTTPFFASTVPACNVTPNGYLAPNSDFGSFLKTLAATNTQAIITVNYGTSLANAAGTRSTGTQGGGTITPNSCSEPNTSGQPQEAAAWVAYANGDPSNTQVIGLDAVGFDWKTVGFWATLRASAPLASDDGYNFLRLTHPTPIGIQYWELGNEIYYNGYSSSSVETDLHAPYIYPSGYTGTYDSRSGIAALSPTAYGTIAIAYLQAMRAVDPTIKIGLVLSSPTVDPIPPTWNPAALTAVCSSSTFDFAIEHYYPGTYNAVTADELLYSPQVNMPAMVTAIRGQLAQYCPVNGTTIPIFLTETNANGTLAAGVPTTVTGLYAAHEFLSGLESGISNIEWLELHDTTGSYLTTGTEAPGPAFYGIQLAHLLANVGDALVLTSSSNAALIAHATSKANGQQGVLLLNSDPTNASTVQVTITGSALGTVGTTATQYSYGIATTQSTAAITSTTLPITGNTFTVTVPPLTATELLIP
ncbi:putative Ig domain-containing protein, partial [Granulicella sp. L60]|uniref:putative Ig domain-containing protein n=1 Tax=Granulicella sp. L60 TaxID=1641866 RepID=UPI00352BA296